jgi:predicted nucleic acid-binding protein
LWADAWLLAIAEAAGGVLVTFDKALAVRGALCLLSKRG